MSRLYRYWSLWQTLPPDERRARAGRLVERLLRQRPAIRRLRLTPDPPRWSSFRRALCVAPDELGERLGEPDPRRGPLHADLSGHATAVAERHPGHVQEMLDGAGRLLDGRIDLLGSGGRSPLRDDGTLDWHRDWKSGAGWPAATYHTDLVTVRGDGSDVKLPWELSRCQHLLVLGQAWRLAPHVATVADPAALQRRCATSAREQIDGWIRSNPRGLGINWACTMDVAIRAAVWLAALGLFRGAAAFDPPFRLRVARSLWSHGRHIRRNLEIGSDGLTSNHYLSDVVGLYAIACALPELREAGGWKRLAREAIEREIDRQVHPDGVGFERSLPYHRLVTELFLYAALLGRSGGDPFPAAFLHRLEGMLEFTATALRDDHTVAQWGDNDDGRLLPLEGYASRQPHDHRHLLCLGGRLLGREDLVAAGEGAGAEAEWLLGPSGPPPSVAPAGRSSRAFADAGYYVMRDRDLHCGISCGPVGTRGVGNHSHNDLLSLCVSADGVEWITDPGTGCYTGDPALRNRLRSTAAHATLQLGRREQNRFETDLDGLFRLDERARPQVTQWHADADGARLTAQHAGFSGEDGRWVHERRVRFEARERMWTIRDELSGGPDGLAPAEPVHLRFPLRPGVSCEITRTPGERLLRALRSMHGGREPGPRERFAVRLGDDGGRAFWIGLDLPQGTRVAVEAAVYSPRYGVSQPCGVVTAVWPAAPRSVALSVLASPDPHPGR